MQSIQKTRFIAANYSNLQGLKTVPLGLLLILVVLWANGQTGRATNLTLPILYAGGMMILLAVIYRYYRVRYGKVEGTHGQKRAEIVLSVLGGLAGLGAFIADTYYHAPISLIGLMFAASIVVEYVRMRWRAPGNSMLPVTLVAFVIMLAVSILPLFGAGEWWKMFGVRAQLFAVLVVAGAIIVAYGLLEHWFFVRQLPAQGE